MDRIPTWLLVAIATAAFVALVLIPAPAHAATEAAGDTSRDAGDPLLLIVGALAALTIVIIVRVAMLESSRGDEAGPPSRQDPPRR